MTLAEEIVDRATGKKGKREGTTEIEVGGYKIILSDHEARSIPGIRHNPDAIRVTLAPLEEQFPELREMITPAMRKEKWIIYFPWAIVLARSMGQKVWGMSIEESEDRRRMISFAMKVAQGMARKQLS